LSYPPSQTDWGYGVVVSVMRRPSDGVYTCDTLLACDPDSLKMGAPRPANTGGMVIKELSDGSRGDPLFPTH
jgi:hypothetical protein